MASAAGQLGSIVGAATLALRFSVAFRAIETSDDQANFTAIIR